MIIRFTVKNKKFAVDTELFLIWGVFILAIIFVAWTFLRSLDFKKGPQSVKQVAPTTKPSVTLKPTLRISITPKVTAKIESATTSVIKKNTPTPTPSQQPTPTIKNTATPTPTPKNQLKTLISPVIHKIQ